MMEMDSRQAAAFHSELKDKKKGGFMSIALFDNRTRNCEGEYLFDVSKVLTSGSHYKHADL